jgi:polysaccharide export outer membrane protein
MVYVVGEVKKPGGYVLKTNENISVLQALALAEGPTRTSAQSRIRIIRNRGITGTRIEIPIDLGKILAGKLPDPILLPKDIVFVPNSAGRSALYRATEAAIGLGTGMAIYRR